MPKTLLLVRHGETDWNAQNRWQGQCDVPLNETGRAQARLLRDRLQRLWERGGLPRPERLVASDLSRAVETATLLETGLALQTDSRLRERGFGSWEGRTHAEVGYAPGSHERAADAESQESVWERVLDAIAPLERVALVVGHGGALRAILAAAAGHSVEGMRYFTLGNTSLSVVQLGEGDNRLVRVNDTAHLES
ncbi:histidine phosphatase family protein [Armatimonas rosea]|uniref:Putative phosphoglycerate mutase n=1 Tax=Armatimonas rosea TaxID=685828 RepID=A0A7W9SSS4_ARMRO|nr:histidine phosphatase family protein [Armatimonas rosea]MBB6052190.1 putative phosphoglycerate mutase [Armatimonas rosea]